MRTLQSLLKDADAKKHENQAVRSFLEDVKDIVYDAEDIIESFLLKESSGNEKWIKRRVKGLSCFLVERRDISIEIEGITKRMSEVVAEMQSFGIKEIMYDGRSLSLKERQRVQREIRQTFPKSSERGLVGVEESVEELVGHLVKNDNIQVVSISGMGGIGKTTLARQVFHHDIVRRHFDGFAWVCVSKEFRRKDIWQKILQDLRPHGKDIKQMDENEVQAIKQMDENELQEKLFPLLGARRHLIVLDDVWQNEDWDRIKDVFPQERGKLFNCWKMILTSRNGGVGLHADPTCFAFTPTILTPEESWELCEQIALSRRDKTEFSVDKELEAMGKKMVKYCGGLPLAVKVLGGLLANKKYTVEAWKRVYDNIQTQIIRSDDNKQDSVYRVLSLSYEDLPMHLKHCFLFLAYFPEDYKISVNKLYFLWAAEGIITSSCDGPTIRESGEEYMEELIRRNMVIVEKSIMSWGQGYCQMHDMMREVCLSKAKEENFLQVIKAPTSTSTVNAHTRESRRLVVHGGNALNLLGRKSNKKARSVLGFGLDSNLWKQSAQGFRNLQLLRVLDLSSESDSGAEFKVRIPSSIGNLIHLRFLSLNVTSGSHLPSSLRNLKLLLYLELSSSGAVYVPNIFKEMVELRYLALPIYMKNKTKLELGNLVNLELLGCFQLKSGSITDLRGMTRLRTLQVIFEGRRSVMAEVVVSVLAEGVVSFGMEKLWDLLSRESERLQGVHEHVTDLERHLRKLQSLLKDADAKKHENEVVRNLLEDVKNIVYDAEDIIESFVLKESSGKEKGIKRRVRKLSCFLGNRRDISIDIEGITKRMSEVVADMQSFGIKEIMSDGRSLSLKERQRVQREIRQTFPKSSEKGLVGVEESVEDLVGHLVKKDNIQVVSISGMGGIGKTTLARQVFHHDIVRHRFNRFAWVCVSKEFQRKDIWQKILQDLRPHDENIKQMDENKLQAELFLLLGKSRHLIVIDDTQHVLPLHQKSLIPRKVGTWKLCEGIALSRRDKTEFGVDKELEDMGKKMVTYCGGLLLAVKVLGGFLNRKSKQQVGEQPAQHPSHVKCYVLTCIAHVNATSSPPTYQICQWS
uniref:NB-ARC domain-containing protein n=1 Tax=Brassica campestris TaxID=3711 RepID=A0A3P5YKN7_BRACM|nr:unnamed protein product [Brassica rapa]